MENQIDIALLHHKAITLLQDLIKTPSISKEEDKTASIIFDLLEKEGAKPRRDKNNVFALNTHFDHDKPTILLNSHHDTVKPNIKYTRDPYDAKIEDGKLFGLGSNDAGGPLVALIMTFLALKDVENTKYNIIIAATAEEEISGKNGIEALLKYEKFPFTKHSDSFAIVGEPTLMHMAIAERGLMVIDAKANGRAGHAAREEGESALLKAVADITVICKYQFEKVSDLLGKTKVSATVIGTENKAHNVVPATCDYTLDCRINECYTFEEVVALLQDLVDNETTLSPRSMRLRSSLIPLDHPIVQAGLSMGKSYYGSPTTSDKALMPFPALKMGPGDSARSHSADEFIFVEEIRQGIEEYVGMIMMLND
jgi:acetylornithine deacetylase/succinyl-diaminopimelate desuccinylase-like protein